jgi:hypothetical protein
MVAVPLGAVGSDGSSKSETVAVHQHFDTVVPFLNEPSKAAKQAIWEHCLTLDLQCLEFADTHGELVLSTVPDNPEFWSAYDSLLAAVPLPLALIEIGNLPAYQGFIVGVNGWVRRELVTRKLTDAVDLHAEVMAHRRRLGLSNILIDKMIFTASTGILLPAINVHMARRDVQDVASTEGLLDGMLRPLTAQEMSLRQVMVGELRYAATRLEELSGEDSRVGLDDLERVYSFVADRSEAAWEDFWRNGLEVSANVEVHSDLKSSLPNWASYAVNLRYLEASLVVLRALREVYEGRVSPGPPVSQSPYGWSWRWKEVSQTLCLDRGYVHASVSIEEPVSICHPYLGSWPDGK